MVSAPSFACTPSNPRIVAGSSSFRPPHLQSAKKSAHSPPVAAIRHNHGKSATLKRCSLWLVILGLLSLGAAPALALWTTRSGARPDRLITIREIASRCGLEVSTPGKKIVLRGQTALVEISTEGREARVNAQQIWLHAPPARSWGRWCLTETDAQKIIVPLLSPASYLRGYGTAVVVLDPGHGGNDPGASSRRGLIEPRIALDIAKRVRAKLINEGFHAYLTRDVDRFIELDTRPRLAAARHADLFISIHLNAAASRDSHGIETYVLTSPGFPSTSGSNGENSSKNNICFPANARDVANNIFGYYLQKNLRTAAQAEDRGVRHARFVVLKEAPCVAALVECGFLSNAADERRLMTDEHRDAIATGIAKGIIEYGRAVRRANPAPPPTQKTNG
ncbi:MAG: N-acetylmuramoyl-L-alanine amidase [Verrucomicrobia bacterium]|nr:MAG: N-acetylmuramoyl-L-alanine amidase [Verrucomicrobiota bacterium]